MSDHAAITVLELEKRFGDVVALDGVDFDVPPGTVFGLLGPNGAGKTTAVRILATVLRPDGGAARVLGKDVEREPHEVRRRIGLAGQFAAIDPNLTGRENLELIGTLAQLPHRLLRLRQLQRRLAQTGDPFLEKKQGAVERELLALERSDDLLHAPDAVLEAHAGPGLVPVSGGPGSTRSASAPTRPSRNRTVKRSPGASPDVEVMACPDAPCRTA